MNLVKLLIYKDQLCYFNVYNDLFEKKIKNFNYNNIKKGRMGLIKEVKYVCIKNCKILIKN